MSAHPYVSEWRESCLPEWRETDLADRITLEAPELRHVSDPAPARCVTTSTNIVIGGACTRVHPAPRAISGPHRPPATRGDRAVTWASAIGALVVAVLLLAEALA